MRWQYSILQITYDFFERIYDIEYCSWHFQSTVASKSYIPTSEGRGALPASKSTLGFDLSFGLPRSLCKSVLDVVEDRRALWASIQVSGGVTDFELQGFRLLLSSHSGFDACFGASSGFPSRFGRCHHRLIGAAPRKWHRGRALEPGADGQSPAASLLGQRCCQWILLYLGIYIVATVRLNL